MRDGRGVSLCGHGDGRGTGTAHAAAAVRECNGHESDRVLSGRSHCASARAPHSANGLANATLVAATKTLLRELASSAAHAACTPFAMGNAAILKPDVQTPIIGGVTFARLLEEAVLPYGVLHAAPSRKSPRKSGLQWTLRWRELDSNFQFRKEQDGFPGRAICVAQAGQKGDPAFAQLPGSWRMSVEGRGPR